MLQRIQSIFLALIAIALCSFMFVNIWDKQNIDSQEFVTLNAFELTFSRGGAVVETTNTVILFVMAFVGMAFAIYSLFSFKKRMQQMMFGLINSIVIAALLGFIIYFSFKGDSMIANGSKGSFGLGLIIPALALICNTVANKFIRKDEEAVKDSNRMRQK